MKDTHIKVIRSMGYTATALLELGKDCVEDTRMNELRRVLTRYTNNLSNHEDEGGHLFSPHHGPKNDELAFLTWLAYLLTQDPEAGLCLKESRRREKGQLGLEKWIARGVTEEGGESPSWVINLAGCIHLIDEMRITIKKERKTT